MQINLNHLKTVAGNPSWTRGEDYFRKGLVSIVNNSLAHIHAVVSGRDQYQVFLTLDDEQELHYQCDCPVNADGACCKHIVATALTASNMSPEVTRANPLKEFLYAQSTNWLANILCNLADSHPDIGKQLLLQQQLVSHLDADAIKKTISSMLGRPRFMDYRQSRDFSHKVRELGFTLEQVLTSGKVGLCVSLCEYTLERLIKIYAQSDDSAGYIGGALPVISDVYLTALLAAQAQEKTKASTFFKLLLLDDWSLIPQDNWNQVLGVKNAAELERKIETEWAKLKPSNVVAYYDHYTTKINRLMELLAQQRGDVDFLIRLYSQDLGFPYAFKKIIDLCLLHDRQREALQWAERGVKTHTKDNDLRTTLAQMYMRDGLLDEALELFWQNFLHHPNRDYYLTLKQQAGADWPKWRSKALDKMIEVEKKVFAHHSKHPSSSLEKPDASLRASCLLAESAIDEVRQLLHQHQVENSVLHELALAIQQQHPNEAVAHMQNVISKTMLITDNKNYQKTFNYLQTMRPWMRATDFNVYINQLRSQYKAKRNFLSLLQAFD